MTQWSAFATRKDIASGCGLMIGGQPMQGDTLAVEYPNGQKMKGLITAASSESITIEIASQKHTLRQWSEGDDPLHHFDGEHTNWTVE